MATLKQKRLAKVLVDELKNPTFQTAQKLLESVRYGKISMQPSRVLKSKGVQEALADLGFTVEGADSVVKDILYDKRNRGETRLNAADKVYKRLGAYAEEKKSETRIVVVLPPDVIGRHIKNVANESDSTHAVSKIDN